jgi:hypothetical protein
MLRATYRITATTATARAGCAPCIPAAGDRGALVAELAGAALLTADLGALISAIVGVVVLSASSRE